MKRTIRKELFSFEMVFIDLVVFFVWKEEFNTIEWNTVYEMQRKVFNHYQGSIQFMCNCTKIVGIFG